MLLTKPAGLLLLFAWAWCPNHVRLLEASQRLYWPLPSPWVAHLPLWVLSPVQSQRLICCLRCALKIGICSSAMEMYFSRSCALLVWWEEASRRRCSYWAVNSSLVSSPSGNKGSVSPCGLGEPGEPFLQEVCSSRPVLSVCLLGTYLVSISVMNFFTFSKSNVLEMTRVSTCSHLWLFARQCFLPVDSKAL